ncbi:7a2c27fe-6df6-40fd-b289-c5cb6694908d [Thermothielavioides terrestris]|uniref:ATPase synthesis protein 25 n=2 Tax=Thermothielavioides terrestris TaxID=2587410 RepID=G2R132_THETT|nr:uncharacterized protein THITE_2114670 [Thermothielavioides terrestris NRRL 8126]AEO66529.1 hypothetical protein THITE_2114670 [Thermothielavioides terrestris NRRL 8126]SPQ20239.1 7a2c27fe-6df6-40fd-b289-c5cb6694908d [Thermothielavioides terrestris]
MIPASTLRAARCSACRQSALRLFLSNLTEEAHARMPTGTVTSRRIAAPTTAGLGAAAFSTFRPTARLLSSPAIEERVEERRDNGDRNDNGEPTASSSSGSGASSSDVPWYLQVEAPRHPTLLHEPSPLPDVPDGSPKLMEPLLRFVADELGMDDLSLLDLRALDPPAALGPDLIMLFGTARSERHLHVSADRLVRWLRGRGVSAKADGLLGRNELKIKLKRMARKAKLLGTSGLAARGEDDGITTGWICVNLGLVGGSHEEVQMVDEHGRPTGFGVPQTGTTIVVQMLTDSRRRELDLETLWSDKLKRSMEKAGSFEAVDAPVATPTRPASRPMLDGRRSFSTSSRRPGDVVLSDLVRDNSNDNLAIAMASDILRHDVDSKLEILSQLKDYWSSLSEEQANTALARIEGIQPSGFLRLYERALENLPPLVAFEHRLWLWDIARARDLPGYDVGVAMEWLRQIQFSGDVLTRTTCLRLIQSVFGVPARTDAAVRDQAALAMQIIDTMFIRGEKVLDHDVLVTVIEALVRNPSPAPEAARLLAQFETLLAQADLPCPSEDLLARLLQAYAKAGKWERFWDVWRIPPRHCQPRSRRLYARVYRLLAEDGHRVRIIHGLRRCYYEMKHEEPPVLADEAIQRGLRDCIRIADPRAEAIAKMVTSLQTRKSRVAANREFVSMLVESGAV